MAQLVGDGRNQGRRASCLIVADPDNRTAVADTVMPCGARPRGLDRDVRRQVTVDVDLVVFQVDPSAVDLHVGAQPLHYRLDVLRVPRYTPGK